MISVSFFFRTGPTTDERWPDDTTRDQLQNYARMLGAVYYTVTVDVEDAHVDPPARVADVERGVRGGRMVAERTQGG